jgi:GT2 family glycosyltransferase
MNTGENICFLIITYEAEKHLEKLFNSIDKKYKIFVVDNGSNDNTINILESKNINYVINKKNGYAAGINIGLRIIKNSGYNYAFVLNQDTEILEFNIDYSLFEKYVIVQPLVLNEDLTVGVDELKMNIYGFVFPYRYKKNVINDSKELIFFSGAGFIINVNNYLSIGDFDENYFMYYEDIDYAVKCLLSGGKIFLTNDIKIIHFYKNSVSSLKKIKQLLNSRKIFINKYLTDLWRKLLFVSKFKKNKNLISQEDKLKFSKYIIKKTLMGFNTKQVPFSIMIFFNFFMFLYSIILKTILQKSLSTKEN